MTKETINTQRRAVCPACFRVQAIRSNGTMVQHGYQRPQGWHQNVGDCAGTGKPHFGTKEGRAFTLTCITACHSSAKHQREVADKVLKGEAPVYKHNYKSGALEVVANPTQREREQEARKHTHEASYLEATAKNYQRRYDAWSPTKPRTVKVLKAAPVVHYAERGGRKLCAGPFNSNPYGGNITTDRAHVTCTRCLTHLKWADARAAAKAKQ